MITEKLIVLALIVTGILFNPIAMAGAAMVISYVFFTEKIINKKQEDEFKAEIAKLNTALDKAIVKSEEDVQKLKDAMISLKMERGITKMVRS